MSRVVILGAGISGHTAALHLTRLLPKGHEIVMVSPNSQWNWIPSNIWVGVGDMGKKDVIFPLAPIYQRKGITFHQAKAVAIWPEGDSDDSTSGVDIVYTGQGKEGTQERIRYDYLINATGPKLNFDATPGLGPDNGHTVSVCTADHAVHAAHELEGVIEKLRQGEPQTVVIGTGHGTCTCQGAAFEYTFNVDHALREAGVREKAEIIYLTNEPELGDFGIGGSIFRERGFETSSKLWTESLYRERKVRAIKGAAVLNIEPGKIEYELRDGTKSEVSFDFSMLIPPFSGHDIKAYNSTGEDITDQIFAPNKFMKVDAVYGKTKYEDWKASDWPKTYRNPTYDNMWAVGIAFAPPHGISKPHTTPNGTLIAPAPPRTGMPSGVTGKVVAQTIADRIKHGPAAEEHTASMAAMGAACVASAGTGLLKGSAAAMTMLPVVPDYEKFETGRDTRETRGEIGLAGHWLKLMLHYLFIYKNKAKFGWWLIPE